MTSDNDEHDEQEVEFEHHLPREEVAKHLQAFAQSLESGKSVSLTVGDETVEFTPPEYLEFEVEYEEYGDEREVEFELEWTVQEDGLEIDFEE